MKILGLGKKPPEHKPPDIKPPNNEKYKLMFFVSNISVSLFNCSDM
jgi:hypothetical protein